MMQILWAPQKEELKDAQLKYIKKHEVPMGHVIHDRAEDRTMDQTWSLALTHWREGTDTRANKHNKML